MKKLTIVTIAYTPIALAYIAALAWIATNVTGWLGLVTIIVTGLVGLQALLGVHPS